MPNTKLSALTELTIVNSGTTLYGINASSSFKIPVRYLDLYLTGRSWASGRFVDIEDLNGTVRFDISNTGVTFITNSGKQVFVASGATHTSIRDSNSIPRFVISGTTNAVLDSNQYARFLATPSFTIIKDHTNKSRISGDATNISILDTNNYQRLELGPSNSILRNWNNKNIIFGNSVNTTLNNPSGGTSILSASGYTNIYSSGDGKLRFTASGDTLKLLDVSGKDRLLINSVGTYLYDNTQTTRMSFGNGFNYIYNKAGGLILDCNTASNYTALRHNTGALNDKSYIYLTPNTIQFFDDTTMRMAVGNTSTILYSPDAAGATTVEVATNRLQFKTNSKTSFYSTTSELYLADFNSKQRFYCDVNGTYINDTGGNNRIIINDASNNGILITDKNALTRISILNDGGITLKDSAGASKFYGSTSDTILYGGANLFALNSTSAYININFNTRFNIDSTSITLYDGSLNTRLLLNQTQSTIYYPNGTRGLYLDDSSLGLYDKDNIQRLNISTGELALNYPNGTKSLKINSSNENFIFYDRLGTNKLMCDENFNLSLNGGQLVLEGGSFALFAYGAPCISGSALGVRILHPGKSADEEITSHLSLTYDKNYLTDQNGESIFTAASGYAIIASGTRPALRTTAGNFGAITFDAGFLYVCTGKGTDKWGRVAISAW